MKNKPGREKLFSMVWVIALIFIGSMSITAMADVTGTYNLKFYPNNGKDTEPYIFTISLPDDNDVTLQNEIEYAAPDASVMFGGWAFSATAELPVFKVGDYAYKVVEAAIAADSSITDGAAIPVYTIWVDTPAVSAKKVEDAQNAVAEAKGKLATVQNDLNTANNNLKAAKERLATAEAKAKEAEVKAGKAEQKAQAAEEEAGIFRAKIETLNAEVKKLNSKQNAGSGVQPQSMTVKTKAITVNSLKNTKIKKSKAFTIKNSKGKVTFYKISGNAKIIVSKNGIVKVKKGLDQGKTYKVKVLVCAAGGTKNGITYTPALKTVTLKINTQKEKKK